jgi:hypothetical protein
LRYRGGADGTTKAVEEEKGTRAAYPKAGCSCGEEREKARLTVLGGNKVLLPFLFLEVVVYHSRPRRSLNESQYAQEVGKT